MAAASNAKTAFQDFLFHYPNSEKAAQARENLELLERKQTAAPSKSRNFTTSRNIIAPQSSTITRSFVSNRDPLKAIRPRNESISCAPKSAKRRFSLPLAPRRQRRKRELQRKRRWLKADRGRSQAQQITKRRCRRQRLMFRCRRRLHLPRTLQLRLEPLPAPPSTDPSSAASSSPEVSASPEASASPAP